MTYPVYPKDPVHPDSDKNYCFLCVPSVKNTDTKGIEYAAGIESKKVYPTIDNHIHNRRLSHESGRGQ